MSRAKNTIFNKNEKPDLSSTSEGILISSEDGFKIDVLKKVSKDNASGGQVNQNLHADISLRTCAQEN